MTNTFGSFLASKRKDAELTQKELADKLFISCSAVSKWEQDKARPDISLLPKLAQILSVTEHELITASEDVGHKEMAVSAKKYRNLVTAWHLFFILSYSITLLTCFIVNLATKGRLDWFFIVFFAVTLSASITTFPQFFKKHSKLISFGVGVLSLSALLLTINILTEGRWFFIVFLSILLSIIIICAPIYLSKIRSERFKFIKNHKLFLISLSETMLILLLLLMIEIMTNGSWFVFAAMPILFTYVLVFLPIMIARYEMPSFIKKHSAMISVILDFVVLVIMLLAFSLNLNQSSFLGIAFPITVYSLVFAVLFVIVIRYLKLNAYLKMSIGLFLAALMSAFSNIFISAVLAKFGILGGGLVRPDFLKWISPDVISANIIAIVVLSLLAISLIFLIIGIGVAIKRKKSK